jgi:hypothetical protein
LTRILLSTTFANVNKYINCAMNPDQKNIPEENGTNESAIQQHVRQLMQTCDDYLRQCDDIDTRKEECQSGESGTRPCLLKRMWLRLKNTFY